MRALPLLSLVAALTTGCTTVIGGDFGDRYPTPTACTPNDPTGADPTQFLRCHARQTCVLAASERATCVDLVAERGDGESCSAANECAAGLVCVSLGFCARSCRADTNDCGAGASCLAFSPTTTLHGKAYGLCTGAMCDPLDPTNDADSFTPCTGSCRFVGPTTACLNVAPRKGVNGSACTTDLDCGQAFVCVPGGDGGGTCRHTCKVGNDAACGTGYVCKSGVGAEITATLNGVEYGYCER